MPGGLAPPGTQSLAASLPSLLTSSSRLMLRSILRADEPAQAEKRVLVKAAIPGLATHQLNEREVRNQDHQREYGYQGLQVDTLVNGIGSNTRNDSFAYPEMEIDAENSTEHSDDCRQGKKACDQTMLWFAPHPGSAYEQHCAGDQYNADSYLRPLNSIANGDTIG